MRTVLEINDDRALQIYGVALALAELLTALFWLFAFPMPFVIDSAQAPICWPFLEDCGAFRFFTASSSRAVLLASAVTAIACATLFWRRQVRPAVGCLAILVCVKLLLLLQDYRLILNQHYMSLWIAGAFLLLPAKRRLIQYLLVSFYWWAGTLKLNHTWLSGAALYGHV